MSADTDRGVMAGQGWEDEESRATQRCRLDKRTHRSSLLGSSSQPHHRMANTKGLGTQARGGNKSRRAAAGEPATPLPTHSCVGV